MFERYTGTLSNYESALVLGAFLLIFVGLFWVIPGIHRSIEKGKKSAFSLRALVFFGPKYLKSGAAFYRIAVYDEFLLMVFWSCSKIKYKDVRSLSLHTGTFPKLSMSIHGVPINIFGNMHQLKELHSKLIKLGIK